MTKIIHPFDIIRITQNVKATLIIHYHAPYTDAIEVEIVPETILLSSISNFDATDVYLFLPKEGQNHHDILEFYKYEIPKGSFLDCSFKVASNELVGKFEVVEQFDYNNLNSNSYSHIFLMANFYFRGNIQQLSTEKWSSFVSDFTPLQKIIGEYNDMLITSNEAVNSIATEIQQQVYSAKGINAENKFPKILGKIDLSKYNKSKKDS